MREGWDTGDKINMTYQKTLQVCQAYWKVVVSSTTREIKTQTMQQILHTYEAGWYHTRGQRHSRAEARPDFTAVAAERRLTKL